MTRAQLEAIAAAIMAAPHGEYATVCLGCEVRHVVEAMRDLGARITTQPHTAWNGAEERLTVAYLVVGGVEFHAQHSEPVAMAVAS